MFVTVGADNRRCLFGEVSNGEMQLSQLGRMILNEWENLLTAVHGSPETNQFVVMPNHVHRNHHYYWGRGSKFCTH